MMRVADTESRQRERIEKKQRKELEKQTNRQLRMAEQKMKATQACTPTRTPARTHMCCLHTLYVHTFVCPAHSHTSALLAFARTRIYMPGLAQPEINSALAHMYKHRHTHTYLCAHAHTRTGPAPTGTG
jgi:hypothetical protein